MAPFQLNNNSFVKADFSLYQQIPIADSSLVRGGNLSLLPVVGARNLSGLKLCRSLGVMLQSL